MFGSGGGGGLRNYFHFYENMENCRVRLVCLAEVWWKVVYVVWGTTLFQGYFQSHTCSLSLWRVVRGSKLMHLELIHGLFIT